TAKSAGHENLFHFPHDLGLADDGGDRHSIRHCLAEGGKVGRDAVTLLRATERDTESGHDLVEDQYTTTGMDELAHPLEEAGPRLLSADNLHDDGGEFTRMAVEQLLEGLNVVEGEAVRQCAHA